MKIYIFPLKSMNIQIFSHEQSMNITIFARKIHETSPILRVLPSSTAFSQSDTRSQAVRAEA